VRLRVKVYELRSVVRREFAFPLTIPEEAFLRRANSFFPAALPEWRKASRISSRSSQSAIAVGPVRRFEILVFACRSKCERPDVYDRLSIVKPSPPAENFAERFAGIGTSRRRQVEWSSQSIVPRYSGCSGVPAAVTFSRRSPLPPQQGSANCVENQPP